MSAPAPLFLTLAEVVEIHSNQIQFYGGIHGVRDIHLLQSALAQPEASFGGVWLHKNIFEMAAAYAFHLSQNHPFLDGNKRTALVSALLFLEMNGIPIEDPKGMLYSAMLKLSDGKQEKEEFSKILKQLSET